MDNVTLSFHAALLIIPQLTALIDMVLSGHRSRLTDLRRLTTFIVLDWTEDQEDGYPNLQAFMGTTI